VIVDDGDEDDDGFDASWRVCCSNPRINGSDLRPVTLEIDCWEVAITIILRGDDFDFWMLVARRLETIGTMVALLSSCRGVAVVTGGWQLHEIW